MHPSDRLSCSLFLAAALFSSSLASAQSRFYLKPSAGVGFSNIVSKYKDVDPDLNKTREVFSYHITAGISYRINKLRIESGVGIMKTGVKGIGYVSGIIEFYKAKYHDNFYYAAIPLRLGYDFYLAPKLSLRPAIGALFTYNMKGPLGGRVRGWQPYNIWGEVQVTANYQISKSVEVFGGPSFQHMASDMTRNPMYSRGVYPYNWTLNAGLNIYFPKKQVADTPKN
jgi:hypothetical protein